MSSRLYYDDSLRLAFDARVVAHAAVGDRQAVVLDASAFYPESGGQMGDHGVLRADGLADARVVDVQLDEAERVLHVVEGAPPPVGAAVAGAIDAGRRRLHMAQHSGQHMLSRALADVARAETVSSRLGESGCTIDVDRESVDERLLAEAEALVSAVIDDDVPVRAWFPEASELRALPLRRAPKVDHDVRVVAIGGFDCSPCGGTHVQRTSQIGLVRVTGVERYKGKARVTFSAGRRARDELARESDALRALAAELTCGPLDVRAGVDKLRRSLAESRDAVGRVRARLADAAAAAILARTAADHAAPIVEALPEADTELLRVVASRVLGAREGAAVLLAGSTPDGAPILAARGAKSAFDCGAFLKRAAAQGGGRGGGKPDRAEGRLPPGADWPAIAARALEG